MNAKTITITSIDGKKQGFQGYRIRRNDGRVAWLASIRPMAWTLHKNDSLIFRTETNMALAQSICTTSGYYTTATLAK